MAVDPRRVKTLFNTAVNCRRRPSDPRTSTVNAVRTRSYASESTSYWPPPTRPPASSIIPTRLSSRLGDLPTSPLPALSRRIARWSERSVSFPRKSPTDSLIGSVIAGRYKIREEIGEGGMGSVYLAEQPGRSDGRCSS